VLDEVEGVDVARGERRVDAGGDVPAGVAVHGPQQPLERGLVVGSQGARGHRAASSLAPGRQAVHGWSRVVRPSLAPGYAIALDDTRLAAASAQTVDGVFRCFVDVLSLDDGSLLGRAEVPSLQLALLRLDDHRFVTAGRDGVVRVFSAGAPSTAR